MNYQAVIFTIGHSSKTFDSFSSLLLENDIQTVIDCRTNPRSRWSHFNKNALEKRLSQLNIQYEFRGLNIGGLSANQLFEETLDELAYRARCGEQIVLMCSEGKAVECHRATVLAPEIENRGVLVKHLAYPSNQSKYTQLL